MKKTEDMDQFESMVEDNRYTHVPSPAGSQSQAGTEGGSGNGSNPHFIALLVFAALAAALVLFFCVGLI